MSWLPVHQTWQMDPLSIKHRHFAYHYSKPGRWIPRQMSIDALNTATPTLADGPPRQSNIDALNTDYTKLGRWTQSIEHRCLEYHYTKVARWTPSIKHRCLEYCYTKLNRWTSSQLNIDALNTTTPNLADGHPSQFSIDTLNTATPNLADGPPVNWT